MQTSVIKENVLKILRRNGYKCNDHYQFRVIVLLHNNECVATIDFDKINNKHLKGYYLIELFDKKYLDTKKQDMLISIKRLLTPYFESINYKKFMN